MKEVHVTINVVVKKKTIIMNTENVSWAELTMPKIREMGKISTKILYQEGVIY